MAQRLPATPATRCALFLIRLYQSFLAPLMPLGCRFYPTCSHYTAEAIALHGVARGIALAARRILRCHPFSLGGYDPVPAVECGSRSSRPLFTQVSNFPDRGAR